MRPKSGQTRRPAFTEIPSLVHWTGNSYHLLESELVSQSLSEAGVYHGSSQSAFFAVSNGYEQRLGCHGESHNVEKGGGMRSV